MITASDFIHPEDAAALEQLESIPGFPTFVKKILELGLEQMQYGINMASAIRLSPTQLPHLYNRLPPICQKLGIRKAILAKYSPSCDCKGITGRLLQENGIEVINVF